MRQVSIIELIKMSHFAFCFFRFLCFVSLVQWNIDGIYTSTTLEISFVGCWTNHTPNSSWPK